MEQQTPVPGGWHWYREVFVFWFVVLTVLFIRADFLTVVVHHVIQKERGNKTCKLYFCVKINWLLCAFTFAVIPLVMVHSTLALINSKTLEAFILAALLVKFSRLKGMKKSSCEKFGLDKHDIETKPKTKTSAFPFLHQQNLKIRDYRIWCYSVAKFPSSYNSPVISIRKQQQLDSFGARDFVDAVSHSLTAEERESLMCQERQRLRTFELGWTHESYLPSREMAKAGFYSLNDADKVQCVFCRGVLHNWLPGDRPMEEHSKHFRNCKLVRGVPCGNVLYNSDGEVVERDMMTNIRLSDSCKEHSSATAHELGINTQKASKPEYAAEASRIRTFGRFPASCPVRSDKICEAGFYYTGFEDTVKCFWCEGGLEKWERGDDPWIEHARHFPTCQFIITMKGHQFISEIVGATANLENTSYVQHSKPLPSNFNSDMIETCLHLGYQRKDIDSVLMKRSRNPLVSVKDLLHALHELEDSCNATTSSTDHESTPMEVDSVSGDHLPFDAGCRQCGSSADVLQVTHIGLPCGCLILCDDCAKKGVPICCPKCRTSLAGLMRVFLA